MRNTKKILIIDDIRTDLHFAGKLIDSFGYEAVLSDSAKAACEMISMDIDLVIVDAIMPEMTGFEFVEKLRKRSKYSHIPVIMVTSLSGRDDKIKAVKSGINDYITKPVDKVELKVRVNSMLKMKEAQDKVRRYQAELENLVARKTKDLTKAIFKLQTVLDCINDIMINVDKDGMITEFNFAFQKLAGKSEKELKVNYEKIFTQKQSESLRKLLVAGNGTEMEIEFEQWGHKIFSIVSTPIEQSNILMMRDVTERHKRDSQRTRFLSILSHELRTPLNGIMGISEFLIEEVKDSELKENLGYILGSGRDMERIVQELLNFVQINESHSSSETTIDLTDIIDKVMLLFSDKCSERGIKLNFDNREEVSIKAVPDHMSEIVKQIIDNAVKFGRDNGNVNISLKKSDKYFTFIVSDDGYGIPEAKLLRVFDSFYQVEDYATREKTGLGLGLTISKLLIENYKGNISIRNNEKNGVEVTVNLPF